jgi:hypothetical protein
LFEFLNKWLTKQNGNNKIIVYEGKCMENIKSPFQDNIIKKYSVKGLIEQFNKGKKLKYVFFWNTDKINLSVGCFSQ